MVSSGDFSHDFTLSVLNKNDLLFAKNLVFYANSNTIAFFTLGSSMYHILIHIYVNLHIPEKSKEFSECQIISDLHILSYP